MLQNPIDGFLVAMNDVEFAGEGSFSLGLRMTALPAAIAIGKNHMGTIAGKLNGEIMPTTPSGWRIE